MIGLEDVKVETLEQIILSNLLSDPLPLSWAIMPDSAIKKIHPIVSQVVATSTYTKDRPRQTLGTDKNVTFIISGEASVLTPNVHR